MVLAFLGGFLQQLLGPRKMLLAAGLPGLLSWLVVVVPAALKVSSSHTVPFLLISRCTFCTFQSFIFSKLYFARTLRILAGLSNSFLTGNVYMADTAPNHLVASFKQIEVTLIFSSQTFMLDLRQQVGA